MSEMSEEFEYEASFSKTEIVGFLRSLADKIERGEITLSGENWDIRFPFSEPVEVDIDYERDRKLSIKFKFRKRGELRV
ncbi:hypothetical protein Asulf_01691 [Archaeoglobus sulfaticallidus PM70-1]|uniref:Amphi-Trp domain-containing protein n=1 Tax=Archaeoglobus sulfaticallidus PM70-1 TaxID=387631 RepID=N0BF66_9EURY|nr:amphi-Trp domain-containing protein [Archaeoglobus sulfaticallidus]AGK61663.1 hypothetical protein Asulf_01691 [Archaeoglobus sulfaticallidus PM70-1]